MKRNRLVLRLGGSIIMACLILLKMVTLSPCSATEVLLQPYPLNDGSMKQRVTDDDGITMIDYGEPRGVQYNPVAICQFAQKCYIRYIKNSSEVYKDLFLKHANFLVKELKTKGDIGVWEYHFPNNFGAKPPWISAMAQGLGISVLSEAYSLTGSQIYLESAKLALNSFKFHVNDGGVCSEWPNGDVWYEEIATKNARKTLNGFIFSLAGVTDFYKLTGSLEAKRIVEKGLLALENHIEEYDLGFVSRYSLYPFNAKWGYNKIHVIQLVWAYMVTGNEYFLNYARKFLSYDPVDFRVSASSTNSPKHPVERLNDKRMMWSYYSAKEFPVEINLRFNESKRVKKIVFYSVSEKTAPKDYIIHTSNGTEGSSNRRFSVDDNECSSMSIEDSFFYAGPKQKRKTHVRVHDFGEGMECRKIKVVILADNGNNNLALREIQVIAPNDKKIEFYVSILRSRGCKKLFNLYSVHPEKGIEVVKPIAR